MSTRIFKSCKGRATWCRTYS